eukprot:3070187-Rhodomonas_salina.1
MGDTGAGTDADKQDGFLTPAFSKPIFLEAAGEDEKLSFDIPGSVAGAVLMETNPSPPYVNRTADAETASFAVGDKVQGKYKDAEWYNAVIVDKAGDTFVLQWDDGMHEDTEKSASELRIRPPFQSGDLVRARRKDGFICDARIVAESGCKYVVEWDDGELATISDGTDLEYRLDQENGGGVGFKIGDRVRAPSPVKGQSGLADGRIVRVEGDKFVIEWEDESLGPVGVEPVGVEPAENLRHRIPPKSSKTDKHTPKDYKPLTLPSNWMPPVSLQSNAMEAEVVDTEEMRAAAAERRKKKALKALLWSVVIILCVAGWCVWIAIPVQYIRVGRHEVRDTWNVVNCTVLAQSCWKVCGGCGCPDSCCKSAEDCVRSNYFMSQTCVWLSQSKYEQNRTDYSAKPNIRNDISSANRRTLSMLLAATVVAGYGILVGKRGHSTLLFAIVALSGAFLAQGGCDCAQNHEVSMTVTYEGLVVTKEMTCTSMDSRSFCKTEFKHRDKSCESLEDMEQKEYCKEPYLNRIGRSHTCYVNPDDASELEISGSKGIPVSAVVGIVLWGVFTLIVIIFGIIVGCSKGR